MDTDFLNNVFLGNSVQNYLLFIVILLFGLLITRICSKLLSKLLFKLLSSFHSGTDSNVFISLLLRPIELLITFIVIYLAINQLDFPLQEVIFRRTELVNKVPVVYEIKVIQIIDKLFLLLFIISVFRIILKIIDFIAHIFLYKASLTESKSDDQMVPFVKELSKILVIIFAVFVVFGSVFNLNVATIIAGLGIGGIAVALAAQDTLQNLLGSFAIFADKPFVVGDLVRIDKYEGTIEKVGFRSTLIRTLDSTMVIIPNKKMVDSPLENLTLRNLQRMRFDIGLRYDTPPDLMMKVSQEIERSINQHPAIGEDTMVNFESFGSSALNIQVLYFIKVADGNDFVRIREEINYQIMNIVSNYGAGFAMPSQTVYHENREETWQSEVKPE